MFLSSQNHDSSFLALGTAVPFFPFSDFKFQQRMILFFLLCVKGVVHLEGLHRICFFKILVDEVLATVL